ncbi:hypothetical protein F4804DRAFT_273085 [Jackrogersella minutella]|nr:hypothetical protein F4804DRAFT_273085 [Jackrogersella minutella]
MVVSTANQLSSTYKLWKRFTFPSENGPRDAVAVPTSVGNQLNSSYALIIDMALAHIFTILFSVMLYFYMRRRQMEVTRLSPLAPTIWNKRSDLMDLIVETVTSSKDNWKSPGILLLLFVFFAFWVGEKATGTLVPPLIIIDYAAPVNPEAIYVPDRSNDNNVASAALFPLEVPRALRALGSTVDSELRQKVNVSAARPMGQTDDGADIIRIDYSYRATGADFGLQKYPSLTLDVAGSCVTDYEWFIGTRITDSDGSKIAVDIYGVFANDTDQWTASLFDGRQPIATFFSGNSTGGALPFSNATWGAIVSSVNRTSFSPGTDPWYLTGPGNSDTGASYSVMPGRPALSCWEDDVWSYGGHNSTIQALTSEALPGLDLSDSLQSVLLSTLGNPMIQTVGQHLQASALLSSTTASDQVFDASVSSVHGDLERLVQAAYVATVNCLTDLTLYPAGSDKTVPNIALGDSGQILDGVADFVVWSPDVTALSTLVIIVVPSVFVGAWVVAAVLMYWTPVKAVTVLDSNDLQRKLKSNEATDVVEGWVDAVLAGSAGNQ